MKTSTVTIIFLRLWNRTHMLFSISNSENICYTKQFCKRINCTPSSCNINIASLTQHTLQSAIFTYLGTYLFLWKIQAPVCVFFEVNHQVKCCYHKYQHFCACMPFIFKHILYYLKFHFPANLKDTCNVRYLYISFKTIFHTKS
jgi:hypothetical protein